MAWFKQYVLVFNVDTIVHKEYVEQSFTGNCVEYKNKKKANSKQCLQAVFFLLGLLWPL